MQGEGGREGGEDRLGDRMSQGVGQKPLVRSRLRLPQFLILID